MIRKLILNDIKNHRLLSVATLFFMTVCAALWMLCALLLGQMFNTVFSLMDQARIPDVIQMHSGPIDIEELESFANAREDLLDWQINYFLNIEGTRIQLDGQVLSDGTQDNGLTIQSSAFDYLLDNDGQIILPRSGEVYVPIVYKDRYGLEEGQLMTIDQQPLTIAGFVRDAQMNSMMSSSKRFLVSEEDYARFLPVGDEEYLIEYELASGADLNAFMQDYATAKLPSNGPSITRALVGMINALSDGTMIFVMMIISVVVLLIALLCIRFILSIQLERDRKEIGMMKALGISRKEIHRTIEAKYLLFSLIALPCGLILALLMKGPLSTQLQELYGTGTNSSVPMIAALFAGLLCEAVILLSIWMEIRKTDRIRAITAMNEPAQSGIRMRQKVLIGILMAACVFLMSVPAHLYHTLSDPSFVSYMGIGNAQIRMDIRGQDDLKAKSEQIAQTIDQNEQVRNQALLQTVSLSGTLADGTPISLLVESGDHEVFPIRYLKGKAPTKENEIALSSLNADELKVNFSDRITLQIDGQPVDLEVCGIYADLTNGGRTAKIASRKMDEPVMWSVIYLSLNNDVLPQAWIRAQKFEGVQLIEIADYVSNTYAQTLHQLYQSAFWAMLIGSLIILAVLGLFCRMMVEKNRYEISLWKALGLTNRQCQFRVLVQTGLPAGIGLMTGLLLGYWGGQMICALALQSLGAGGFVLLFDPWAGGVLVPVLALVFATSALIWGVQGIRKIQAVECCRGRE